LDDRLILRRATPADLDRLLALQSLALRDPGEEKADERILFWTRDLMSGDHPTFDAGDFTLVEDQETGTIASSMCLISQTWSYGGVPFGVGRVEIVCTHPDYRRRGLIRAQFEVVHRWSAQRGEKMQGITGIPYFYRQFGYEMGLALSGGRMGFAVQLPRSDSGEDDAYCVRPATEADLPFITQVYAEGARRYLVTAVRDEAIWRYELTGKHPQNANRYELRLIETRAGKPVGFLAHAPRLRGGGTNLDLVWYELSPGVPWHAVTPSVLRYLRATGAAYAEESPGEFISFTFRLSAEHPAYRVIPDRLPQVRDPYAWYVRVPDLPDFLHHVAPVLERRLAQSHLVGYTGELKVSFYRDGLRLAFEEGKLEAAEAWQPTFEDGGGAAFPDLTFLQLLLGYRSLEELDYAFADCWAGGGANLLLDVLFPKQDSDVWPIA
jgi:GNAT superfamily N-acetyltransferase